MEKGKSVCKAKNKQGQPCAAAATTTGYCYLHSNRERAADLGRTGGRKNRHVLEGAERPLPSMDTLGGLRAAIAQLVIDVYEGRVDPRRAAGMTPLLKTLLRVSEAEEMEARMATLEKQVEELQNGPSESGFEENSDPVN